MMQLIASLAYAYDSKSMCLQALQATLLSVLQNPPMHLIPQQYWAFFSNCWTNFAFQAFTLRMNNINAAVAQRNAAPAQRNAAPVQLDAAQCNANAE
jgi:hypothetical protein